MDTETKLEIISRLQGVRHDAEDRGDITPGEREDLNYAISELMVDLGSDPDFRFEKQEETQANDTEKKEETTVETAPMDTKLAVQKPGNLGELRWYLVDHFYCQLSSRRATSLGSVISEITDTLWNFFLDQQDWEKSNDYGAGDRYAQIFEDVASLHLRYRREDYVDRVRVLIDYVTDRIMVRRFRRTTPGRYDAPLL